MKVKDLIKELSKVDQEADVMVPDYGDLVDCTGVFDFKSGEVTFTIALEDEDF